MLTLQITGFAADPTEVSSLLDLCPSRTAVSGQPRTTGGGRPYHFNGWWLEIRSELLKGRGVEHAEAIAELIGLLRSREALFVRLRHELKPEALVIYGAMEVPWNEQCGIWLDAADMTILAACGIDWGVDLVAIDRSIAVPAAEFR
jgi:hypothetical protein